MSARGSLWLPLAMLLLLAALSYWIERSVQAPATGALANPTEPEGIMENFDALRTDTAGNPHYRLSAKRLKHYSGSKLTELESPRFVQLDAEAGEVNTVAKQATVSPDGSEVDLLGDVIVERAARRGELLQTRTRDFKTVLIPGTESMIGSYLTVELTGTTGSTFTGAVVQERLPLSVLTR